MQSEGGGAQQLGYKGTIMSMYELIALLIGTGANSVVWV